MPLGIVTPDVGSVDEDANFFIPSVPLEALPVSLPASHVILHPKTFSSFRHALARLTDAKHPIILLEAGQLDYCAFVEEVQKFGKTVGLISPPSFCLENWRALVEEPCFELVILIDSALAHLQLARIKALAYAAVQIKSVPSLKLQAQIMTLLAKPLKPPLLIPHEVYKLKSSDFWRTLSSPFVPPYLDLLIEPLQPLANQLSLGVYENFEKDQVKYSQYASAIELAIYDLRKIYNKLQILVIGPGRGPLLRSVIKCLQELDSVVAVEKNPACRQILQGICADNPQQVQLVIGDIRECSELDKFHLVVSELLGSFGCNEACPEILDLFRASSAVMIPQQVSSFVHPALVGIDFSSVNSPVLCEASSAYSIFEPQKVFEFEFPGSNPLNVSRELKFNLAKEAFVANALLGYFEATLYGPYKIGIRPNQNPLEKCSSWFPIVFPIHRRGPVKIVKIYRTSATVLNYAWNVDGEHHVSEAAIGLSC